MSPSSNSSKVTQLYPDSYSDGELELTAPYSRSNWVSTLGYGIEEIVGSVDSIIKGQMYQSSANETNQPLGGEVSMPDNDWLKILIEKLDQDRRSSEERSEQRMQRIEHLIERQADQMDSLRKEIKQDLGETKTKVEQAFSTVHTFAVGSLIGLGAIIIAFIFALWQILKATPS